MNKDILNTSGKTDWETPWWLFNHLNKEFNFTLDLCATVENKKCEKFYSPEDSAFTNRWTGTCWLNPPYGEFLNTWLSKARKECMTGNCTVVALLPARTDTAWFHDYCIHHEIRFLRGRINFVGGKSGATFPSMIVIFNKYSSGVKFIDTKDMGKS